MTIPFPKVLRIEPASKCNFGCIHCPTGTIEMARGVMSLELFEKIISEIKKNAEYIKVIVLYHGGEPFLNKNFFHMLKEIKKINKNIFVKTVSNGSVLTEKTIKQIVESELDLIEFSLDGQSARDSEKIRKKSKSEVIIKNIKELLNQKKILSQETPKVNICSTQFFENKSLVKDNISPETANWILDNFKTEQVSFKNFFAMQWPSMTNQISNFDKVKVENAKDKDNCNHIEETLTIRSDGAVVPCCYDLTTELKMGNVMNESLQEIWDNSAYHNLRETISSKKYISICKNCNVVRPPIYLVPKPN
mgnify:FL=1